LPPPIHDRLALLLNDKPSRHDEPADLEEMPVPPFARPRRQRLQLDLGEAIRFQLLLEIAPVHSILPVRVLAVI
jgi:hypothetical protein